MSNGELYGVCVLAGKCVCGICSEIPSREYLWELIAQNQLEMELFMQHLDRIEKARKKPHHHK